MVPETLQGLWACYWKTLGFGNRSWRYMCGQNGVVEKWWQELNPLMKE